MEEKVVHVFSPKEETYLYPEIRVVDEEDDLFSLGETRVQTLFVIESKEHIYKAGKKWRLIKCDKSSTPGSLVRTIKLESSCIHVYDESGVILQEDNFNSLRDMLFAFESRYDPEGKSIKAHCAICNIPLDEFFSNYPNPICRDCEKRTLNNDGQPAVHDSQYDYGDNPVFIDGKKCWRRYKFGGYITMLDDYDCQDLREFYERHRE